MPRRTGEGDRRAPPAAAVRRGRAARRTEAARRRRPRDRHLPPMGQARRPPRRADRILDHGPRDIQPRDRPAPADRLGAGEALRVRGVGCRGSAGTAEVSRRSLPERHRDPTGARVSDGPAVPGPTPHGPLLLPGVTEAAGPLTLPMMPTAFTRFP